MQEQFRQLYRWESSVPGACGNTRFCNLLLGLSLVYHFCKVKKLDPALQSDFADWCASAQEVMEASIQTYKLMW